MDSRKKKIGVLVPYSNTNLEPDMMRLCPDGCTMHFQRLGGYDVDKVPDSDQMAGLGASDIDHDLTMISGVRPAVVLYGCTSATLTHGRAFDRDLAARIKRRSGALSLTAAESLVRGLGALGVARVGFASPYVGQINAEAVAFLSGAGFQTVRCHDIGRSLSNYGQGELTPDEVYALAVAADHPDAQAIVLSCTDMRSVEVIGRVEAALGKPVVTSNQAMVFALMQDLGLPRGVQHAGALFDLL
ncbi:maleate cis-trans isomerase family protein [Roseovarius pelagicus]|uniref:Asp/Glu racemase n=1 Tax=Roseovarius pelagicus TaxID=2980108 RepID=A0ABY6DG88_9RHOB|nr:Asp/Glu racemase [Roseovarius pelagicus]UXX85129.1 Asp/Glu racemase [Roseovarius pelagicus]